MAKIKITEKQSALLKNLKPISEAEETGVKSVGVSIGEKVIRIVISGVDLIKFKDRILALITRQDPEAKVAYFDATGKIVGTVKGIKLDSIVRDIKSLNPEISVEEKPIVKSLKEITKKKINEKEHRVQQHDFSIQPTTLGSIGLKTVPIRISGPNVGKLQDTILREIKYRDPKATVAYFIKTGKIVGNIEKNILPALEIFLKNLDSSIEIEEIRKKTLTPQMKVTQEQYDRLIKPLTESDVVKGGLNRVDKTFKKEFASKDVQNLKEGNGFNLFNIISKYIKDPNDIEKEIQNYGMMGFDGFSEPLQANLMRDTDYISMTQSQSDNDQLSRELGEDKFNIKKPNSSVPKLDKSIGNRKPDINEDTDAFKREVDELIKFLYGKTNYISPYWEKNGIGYNSIINALFKNNVIIRKDDVYELSKSLGTPEAAIQAVETTLKHMIPQEMEEIVDPTTQKEPQYTTPTVPKIKEFKTIAMNPEIAILKNAKGEYFVFNYVDLSKKDFQEYAEVEKEYVGKDDEGQPDFDYSDDFDIDAFVIDNYVNDNIGNLSKGVGLDDFESGMTLVKIDKPLKDDLIRLYDKDKTTVTTLSSIEEEVKSPEEVKGALSKELGAKPEVKKTPEAIKAAIAKKREEELNRRKGVEEMTGAASSGAFTGPMNAPVVKRQIAVEEPIDETTTTASSGQYTANAFPNIDRNGKFKDTKTKVNEVKNPAQVKTQYPKGGFVEFNDCTKLNNGKGAQNGGCNQGAVSNVVKVKKSKKSVISPSLDENAIIEQISKQTGKTVDEVKNIISTKIKKTK